MNATVIATHLNATEVLEIREWAHVLWVKAVRAGKTICRFVSKRVSPARRAVSTTEAAALLQAKVGGDILVNKDHARLYLGFGSYIKLCCKPVNERDGIVRKDDKSEALTLAIEWFNANFEITSIGKPAPKKEAICWHCHVNSAIFSNGLCASCID